MRFNKVHCLFKAILARGYCKQKTEMPCVLNVAEKNDAAKSLADIMSVGRFNRREGFSRFNKIYEFDYRILNQNVNMTMTSVSGHLLTNDFIGQYRFWNSCNPVELFDAPVAKMCPDNFVDIKRTLEREIKRCQTLIIWTDGDREGENIGFEIIEVCKAIKPNITVYRARFSEITRAAIQRAVNNLQPPNKNVSDAVEVRMELDLRIGAAFTRFQTMRLKKVFPNVLADQLISYGSCQFPTLGFVVERYKQVQAFIPEPFWKIKVQQETQEGVCEFLWQRQRLFDHLACFVFFQHVIENPVAEVTSVKSKPKSKWRPVALDTVELEKTVSRKLKIGAKETMQIAEKLYTKGFISYPRTETNIFPKELDLANLIEIQTQDRRWGVFAASILQTNGPNPRNGNKSDQAHPPIHPTKYTENLEGNEARVYEFIVRHFLACCSEDAKGQETSVEIVINEEKFHASGLMVLARNYLDVYPYENWSTKTIPVFEVGEQFEPSLIEMNQSETSPPSLLTEADLIALMDKHGIGTDATHAEHIETIKSRLYVGTQGDGKLLPGELGMGLVEGYDAMGYEMSKPHLRAELEADLKRICEGLKNKDVVLNEQIAKYKDVFVKACEQANKIDSALSEYFGAAQQIGNDSLITANQNSTPVTNCPKCGSVMVVKTKKDGKGLFLTCMGYPNCKNAIWFPSYVLEANVQDERCSNCGSSPSVQMIKFKFKHGSVPPHIPTDYVTCIKCDEDLKQLFDVKSFSGSFNHPQNNTVQQSRSSQNRSNSNSSVSRQPSQGNVYTSSSSYDSGISSANSSFNRGNTQSFHTSSYNNSTSRQQPQNPGFLGSTDRKRSFSNVSVENNGSNEEIVCPCNESAKLLTVKKNGPNCGRQFYSCAKPQDSRCGFFLWADDNTSDNRQQTGRNTQFSGGNNTPGVLQSRNMNTTNNETVCKCNIGARLLTVQKEGPNKGRQFYGCSKPREQSCGFFQWADENGGNSNGGATGGTANFFRGNSFSNNYPKQSSTYSGGTTRTKQKPKCSICRQEGHNKKNCPQNR